eukprot:COSAG04_NODE_29264_length_270_cov_0.608187_1_plen_25_part_10
MPFGCSDDDMLTGGLHLQEEGQEED